MHCKECKYVWTTKEFDDWVKRQTEIARKRGIRTSTAGVTQMLMENIIRPNNINDIIPKTKPIKVRKMIPRGKFIR